MGPISLSELIGKVCTGQIDEDDKVRIADGPWNQAGHLTFLHEWFALRYFKAGAVRDESTPEQLIGPTPVPISTPQPERSHVCENDVPQFASSEIQPLPGNSNREEWQDLLDTLSVATPHQSAQTTESVDAMQTTLSADFSAGCFEWLAKIAAMFALVLCVGFATKACDWLTRDSLIGTTWRGSEILPGFGALTFEFRDNQKAVMTDAKSVVHGKWSRDGKVITITFANCEYRGVQEGSVIHGTANYFVMGQLWPYSVRKD